ncbi:uncharacterized protein PV06_03760 [Exophiala oligosperma]|uniref:Man(5)GlcNAc(2)-PP-dolichol translocation protein RFT1 n=2 Tax=Chaetothyriales TaxID=34395 RepID=A0A0D2EBJ5_9EURO|nr:uncharacterized protein PV06_03760 [Exophiala oligosperma]KAJ9641736.1 Oligosaccharide translocation protein rft1 [Knufia peltigerae]KIW45364.1 hypothetical protein PV06_03760 [Exophiala oligosperma]
MNDPGESPQGGSATILLIMIQVASRALTFIGNQFLLRFLSPSLLGISVQVELVSVTSLYFARESLRVALQRQPATTSFSNTTTTTNGQAQGGRATQTVVNLAYLAVLLGFIISTAFGYSYLRGAPSEVLDSPYFIISFQVYAFATLTELLAEPAFVVIQQKALYADRARAETLAATARCLAACITAVVAHGEQLAPSILPFAAGQSAYAFVLLALYFLPVIRISRSEKFSLAPRKIVETSSGGPTRPGNEGVDRYYARRFHKAILGLAATMYMQSIFKLLLTQGDTLIMSFLSSLADQGAFALASNYGGLLARLVFQPVEESSRNTFGRLLSSPSTSSNTISSSKSGSSSALDDDSRKANIREALAYLSKTLRFYTILALPLVSIAPHVLPLVVGHIVGAKWSSTSTASLLSTYCYYIPLMAVNGILDAFVTSVASPAQLRTQSAWMLLFTGLYGVAAWTMLKRLDLGAAGLVGANMVNMALRIVWSIVFVRQWVQEHDTAGSDSRLVRTTVREGLPASASVAVAGLVALTLKVHPATGGRNGKLDLLNREPLGLLGAGTVILGSTM